MKFLAHISCLPNCLNIFTLHEVTSEIDLLLLFLGGTSLAYILQNHKMWQYIPPFGYCEPTKFMSCKLQSGNLIVS